MELHPGAVSAAFFAGEEPLASGDALSLGHEVARHVRARRIAPGERVTLLNGAGTVATAEVRRIARHAVQVVVLASAHVEPLPPIHLLLPVADKDRTLWLAEKATELGVTSWRPVLWHRSRSVAGRGEGIAFQAKVRSRMIAALEQSGAAYMPQLFPVAAPERALAALPDGLRVALDPSGIPLARMRIAAPLTLACGPEGGWEKEEIEQLEKAGFVKAALGGNVLRFETAALAGLAVARAFFHANS
ncbi:MAG TPA: RsmE family RNA methyltransferase [Gemmatimonadaceae bacterium]|nr:RsmE family RNA methyltransferase [Gemmatimonadaceae bacterium]